MSEDTAPGTVTICAGGRQGLDADDSGVTVRGFRARRLTWPEISHFEDGSIPDKEGYYLWALLIVLHSGERVKACAGSPPAQETLAAIRDTARRYGIPAEVTGVPMLNGRPTYRPETVRIGAGLRADRLALTVSGRRFEWAEIIGFADGGGNYDSGRDFWELVIALTSGRTVAVTCKPSPETLAAIREVAERHGIPAEVTGIPMKNGRPITPGLYRDPGGRDGLRYWDGNRWSPLLPPDVGKSGPVRDSAVSWAALPAADGNWTYAATWARRGAAMLAVSAALSAALLAGGLATELWWDRGSHHKHLSGYLWFGLAALALAFATRAWKNRRLFVRIDQAARNSASGWQ
jgi:hypothetical protein